MLMKWGTQKKCLLIVREHRNPFAEETSPWSGSLTHWSVFMLFTSLCGRHHYPHLRWLARLREEETYAGHIMYYLIYLFNLKYNSYRKAGSVFRFFIFPAFSWICWHSGKLQRELIVLVLKLLLLINKF